MRKKDKMKYLEYDDEAEESQYDFSKVELRGEGHTDGFYEDIESFSFDDDSYGELPFEEDEELQEEDFVLKSANEKNNKNDFDIDVSEDLYDDDIFDFGDDEADDIQDEAVIDIADVVDESVSDVDSEEAVTDIEQDICIEETVAEVEKPKKARTSGVRFSDLQPLLVINKSKHSFGSVKKKQYTKEEKSDLNKSEEFDSINDSIVDTGDDDIEDISDTLDMAADKIPDGIQMVSEEYDNSVPEEMSETDVTEEIFSAEAIESNDSESSCIEEYKENDINTANDTIDEPVTATSDDSLDNTLSEELCDDKGSESYTEAVIISEDRVLISIEENETVLEDVDSSFIAEDRSLLDGELSAVGIATEDTIAGNIAVNDNVMSKPEPISDDNATAEADSATPKQQKNEKKLLRRKKKRKKIVKNLIREVVSWTLLVIVAFAIAIIVNLYVARPSIVSGTSMLPTLKNGDTIVISKIPYMLGEVEYGDIVVIDRKTDRERTFAVELTESLKYNALTQSLFDESELSDDIFWVKRIIGKPGDVIEFLDGKVYRNGELLVEDYILTQNVDMYLNGQQVVVKEGCIFVMGDNRNASLDSRALAANGEQIEMDHIVGKLISK